MALLPGTAPTKDIIAAVNALDARVTALEAITQENRAALRAIFTVFHPEPAAEGTFALMASEAQHTLLHEWLDKFGGRAELPPNIRMR